MSAGDVFAPTAAERLGPHFGQTFRPTQWEYWVVYWLEAPPACGLEEQLVRTRQQRHAPQPHWVERCTLDGGMEMRATFEAQEFALCYLIDYNDPGL